MLRLSSGVKNDVQSQNGRLADSIRTPNSQAAANLARTAEAWSTGWVRRYSTVPCRRSSVQERMVTAGISTVRISGW